METYLRALNEACTTHPNMPRCTFEDIPNEILLQIVQDSSVQLSEQLCLSLTSRRLHSIVELSLYRSVDLRDQHPATGRRLRKLLRTIASRPELGAIIRHLKISVDFSWIDSHDLDEREVIIIQKLAREKGMSSRAVSELGEGLCQSHFSLVMHLVPKLESLDLSNFEDDREMKTGWAWTQGEYHGPAPVGLQSLLRLGLCDTWAAKDVRPFMSLPALNSLVLSDFEGEGAIHWDEGDANAEEAPGEGSLRFVKRSSKLKELHLILPIFEPPLLENILQIPEALDTFTCEWESLDAADGIDGIRRVVHALRYHANSLTSLSLILWYSSHPPPHVNSIVSIRDFSLLKDLTVSCLFLVGHTSYDAPRGCTAFFDLLPSTLTSLAVEVGLDQIDLIDGDREGSMVRGFLDVIQDGKDGVKRWRRERRRRVPHLKEFSLWIWEDPIDIREELDALGIIIHPRSNWD